MSSENSESDLPIMVKSQFNRAWMDSQFDCQTVEYQFANRSLRRLPAIYRCDLFPYKVRCEGELFLRGCQDLNSLDNKHLSDLQIVNC